MNIIVKMENDYCINEVLAYLKEWRSNRDIKNRFNLSQNQFYRLSRWMVKGGFVKRCTSNDIGLDCNDRITFYKIKNN